MSALVNWIGSGSGSAKIADVKLGTVSDPFFRGLFELLLSNGDLLCYTISPN